jgi:hypothetical protein
MQFRHRFDQNSSSALQALPFSPPRACPHYAHIRLTHDISPVIQILTFSLVKPHE